MCEHNNFQVSAKVGRLTKSDEDSTVVGYVADIEIHCIDCFMPFSFIGLPIGINNKYPTVNYDATELRAPIKPV